MGLKAGLLQFKVLYITVPDFWLKVLQLKKALYIIFCNKQNRPGVKHFINMMIPETDLYNSCNDVVMTNKK